jgi:hypothetical protein
MKNGLKHGKGKMKMEDGKCYEGQYVNGLKHGDGMQSDGVFTFKARWANGFMVEIYHSS